MTNPNKNERGGDKYQYPTRLDEQLEYHSKKSKENQKKFYMYQLIVIIAGALVPIVNTFNYPSIDGSLRIISSILGGIVVIVTGILQMYKHQENWILFRTTQELLKREKALYLNDAGDYFGLTPEQKKKQLVERTEALITAETSKYFAFHKPEEQQSPTTQTSSTTNTPSQSSDKSDYT
jgi:uncharacterized protein DUF4231